MGVLRILAVAVLLGVDSSTVVHAQECCTGRRWTGCQNGADCGSDLYTGNWHHWEGPGGRFCFLLQENHYECATNCVCTPCSSNQYESSPPEKLKDRVCTAYQNCKAGTYISVEGTPSADRQCQPCPSGQFTNSPNLNTCSPECQVVNYEYLWGGWSDDGCGKEQSRVEVETCNAPSGCTCANQRSIKTERRAAGPCTTVTTTTARAQECCTGRRWTGCIGRSDKRCGANQVYTGKWNGPPDAVDHCKIYECATNCGCTPCSSNQYETSPPSTYNDRGCTSYQNCNAGTYISVQGTPTADRQCQACPSGQFTNIPNLNTCSQHSTCGQGQYISSDVLADTDRRCLQCPDGQYQEGSGHQLTTCTPQSTCGPGEKYVDGGGTQPSTCAPCTPGTFQSMENHRDECIIYLVCDAGKGQSTAVEATATTNRICAASQECTEYQWEAVPLTPTTQRQCSAITRCTPGEYVIKDPIATSDRICGDCDGAVEFSLRTNSPNCTQMDTCSKGEYAAVRGSRTKALVCKACPGGQFQTLSGQRPEACFEQPRCARGEYLYRAGLGREGYCSDCPEGQYAEYDNHRDANCNQQPFCQANEYLAGGDVTAKGTCTACPEGTVQPSENHWESQCDLIVYDFQNNTDAVQATMPPGFVYPDDDAFNPSQREGEGIESNASNGEGESNGGGGNPAQTTTVDLDAQPPPSDLQPTKSTNGAAIAVPLVLILLIGLGAGYWVYYRRKKKRHPPGQGQAAEIIEMVENPMPAAAAARAASIGSAPAVHAAAVQAGDVIYVSDNGASDGLAGEQDEGVAMATYSVPHANRDPTYSGYEAPGTNGGSSNSTPYATPMEDDGAGRVPNPMYQSADGNGRELARVPNPMYQSADGTSSTTNISSA